MAQVLLITTGTLGDLLPFLAIGKKLQACGHEVTVITHDVFRETVEADGLRFAAFDTKADYERLLANADLWHWRKTFPHTARELYIPSLQPMYDQISDLIRPGPTILIARSWSFAARIAQEQFGLPLVTVHLQPLAIRTVHDTPLQAPFNTTPWWTGRQGKRLMYSITDYWADFHLRPAINQLRAKIGLKPVRKVLQWADSPQRIIGLWPQQFAPVQPDWKPHVVLTGFVNVCHKRPTPALLEASMEKQPPILFTIGTAMSHGRRFFAVAAEACRILNRHGLLVTRFADQIPTHLPPFVTHVASIPYDTALPKCAAIVHHGGIGTAAQALAAGIPQIVYPMMFDQFDNARRLTTHGVCRRISPSRLSAKRLAGALQFVLSAESVAASCRYWKSQIDFQQALQQTCDVIENELVDCC